MECKFLNGMPVLTGNVELEVLLPTGKLAKTGTSESVVTNFWSWAMPFIRHRTGNFGTVEMKKCECAFTGTNITNFSAREPCFLNRNSEIVNFKEIDYLLAKLPLKGWQIIQEGSRIKVNRVSRLDSETYDETGDDIKKY